MKKPDEDERRNTRWLAGYDYETQREVTQKGRCNVVQAIATAPVSPVYYLQGRSEHGGSH